MGSYYLLSQPGCPIQGELTVPGDKSITHRAIFLASIAMGLSKIKGFLNSDDCLASVNAFKSMGVQIELESDVMMIQGVGKYGLSRPKTPIDCGNSGTTLRLLTGLLAAQAFDSQLTGDESLKKRPMERLSRPLVQMGANITHVGGCAPLHIRGGQSLVGIDYEMPEASAQVKSGLLLAGLYADGETRIEERFVTRDHTERMLAAFSYPVHKADNFISVNGLSQCLATEINVPGDLSSAAFFMVAATLIPGSKLLIKDVGINPTRIGVIKILTQMGARLTITNKRLWGEEAVADILVESASLEGIVIPASMVPLAIDEFPIIFIAAACAQGQTLLHGAKELRYKECDRIEVMVQGLNALGIEARSLDDGLCIQGGSFSGGVVDSHGCHRVAMAFAIAGSVAKGPIQIKNSGYIKTSFPQFVTTAKTLNLNIQEFFDA